MILTPAAALLASGLVMPEPPRIHIPSPAIVRAQNIELSRHMLRAMPLTMGLLIPRRQQGIAFVGLATATKAGATSGNTTLSLSSGLTGGTRSAVQAGDLVIAAYSSSSTANRTLAITDGTTAYTLIGSELYANDTYDINLRVAYKFMGSTPDTATTFGPTGSTSDAGATAVYVFSGVNATTPLDVAATTATGINSGLPNPPSITPVTAGAYIMCVGANAGFWFISYGFSSSTLTSFASLFSNGTNATNLGIGLKTDWTSGAFDCPAFTMENSDIPSASWAAVTIALRPA